MSEIRHALRRLRATPVVTLSAVACLSIAVWMTCIMSAVMLGIFRPDLRVPHAERLVQLDELGLYSSSHTRGPICCGRLASRSVYDSMAKLPYFAAIGTYAYAGPTTIEGDGNWHVATQLSSGMMTVLGAVPRLGRGFVPADDTVGGVILISDHLWRTRFGGDSAIIGRRLRLRGEITSRTIVGVMKPDFVFPRDRQRPELYLPITSWSKAGPVPAVQVLARLRDDVDIDEAEQAVRAIAIRSIASDRAALIEWFRAAYTRRRQNIALPSGGIQVSLERYYTEPLPDFASARFILILACGFAVAGIAAANVVNLLLVRGVERRPEIAVRMAMGATRLRVIRELVVEVALLAVPAVLIGLIAADRQWARLNPAYSSRHLFGEIDARVGVIAMLSGLALALLVGVWPALRATSFGLDQAMRDPRRSGFMGSPLDGLLGRLVAASTAATVVLLIAAVLLGLSARDSWRGTVADRNLYLSNLTFDERQSQAERISVARETLNRLRAMPGMATAALGHEDSQSLIVSTTSDPPSRRLGNVDVYTVTDGYFAASRTRILRGREFSARETRDSVGKVVINRNLAGRLFPGRNGIGERFRFHRLEDSSIVDAEVIGIAEDVPYGATIMPRLYLSLGSAPVYAATALARYKSDAIPRPRDMTAMLRDRPALTATTVQSHAEKMTFRDPTREYISFAFAMFATVGLVLAIIGTYGVVAYSVVRRTHEIGVRMALGAEGARVTRMVIEHGLKITLVGIIVGIALSIGTMRFLGSMVMDVRMGYPAAIGGVIALVVVLSFIASAIPALRAGRLNPVDALRSD